MELQAVADGAFIYGVTGTNPRLMNVCWDEQVKHYSGDPCEWGEVDRRTAIEHLLWTWEFRAMIGLQVFMVVVVIVAIFTGRLP